MTGASDNLTSFKQGETTHPWAHRWAQRLAADLHQSPQFVAELEQLTARMPEAPREDMRTALSWMVAAYYEQLKGCLGYWRKCCWNRQYGARHGAI